MRRFAWPILGAILSTVMLPMAARGAASQTVAADQPLLDTLLALNRAYIAAARAGDVAAMQAMATDDYVAVNPYYAYMLNDVDKFADEQRAWAAYFKPYNGDQIVVRTEAWPIVKRFDKDTVLLAYNELEASTTPGARVRAGRTGKCSFIYRRVAGRWKLANSIITEQAWPDRMTMGIRK